MSRKIPALAAGSLLSFFLQHNALAADMPADIWSGRHGGFPSITVNPQTGVSVALPAQAVEEMGGGSMARIVKSFLEKWGPGICSDAFDFQSPHQGLAVQVALMKPADRPAANASGTGFYDVSGYVTVTIDYEPGRQVTCVRPDNRTS